VQRSAIRVSVREASCDVRTRALDRARELGLLGWVRRDDDGLVRIHAEGAPDAVQELAAWLDADAGAEVVERASVKVEGHEQLAVRGVPAGAFVVLETLSGGFELRLEVDGAQRAWLVPKGPSMNPADKRFVVALADVPNDARGTVWDRGAYEQGGRVPWPEAIERGHAVFVLHGEKLRGGFALQRTGQGPKARWLLVKRKDAEALP
jgi:acylphosphatase